MKQASREPEQTADAVEAPPARSLAGIHLAPGFLPRHALIYLYAAFVTVGLFAFISFFQAWLLNVNLRLPEHLQGRTVSALNFANELVALALVAPFGALADKIGRRPVYAFGFLWLGAGFLLYPLARTVPQLTGCALFFSVGVAAVGTMLGTVLADTPDESSRGRMVGTAGFFQGLGAAVLVMALGRLPKWLQQSGYGELEAGTLTLWLASALCLLSAVVVFAGLRRGSPSAAAAGLPLRRIVAEGLAAARGNRRIWFAYLLQFGSFGDRVVLGTFLSLRLQQAWLERGLGMADAADRARWPFVAAMIAGLLTALVVGVLLDRVDRVRVGVVAMALAAAAYALCGFLDDPTQDLMFAIVAVLLGMGQIAAIIAGQTLLGQEAPQDVRGAVFGLAGICASAAILFTNAVGGWLYDSVSKGGPFYLLAGVNVCVFLFGLRLASRGNASRST
ncbi:MAG TPA: MFS transporter [Steroidobacteraceae bacterium]|nr:MFS transporter [Steroidobacteraceae bacterium]